MLEKLGYEGIKQQFLSWGFGTALLAIGSIWGFPIFYAFFTSLKKPSELYQWSVTIFPHDPTFQPYLKIFRAVPFGRYYLNSILVCTVSVMLVLWLGSMAGYAFSKLEFKGRSIFLIIILGTMMIPPQALLIPLFVVLKNIRVINTYWALILPYTALSLPLAIFILSGFFDQIPDDLQECARIDGANWYSIYWRIMLPLARPALGTVAIYTFVRSWKDFIIAITMTNSRAMRTVPVGIAMISNQASPEFEVIMAASMLASVPMILVFLIMQKQFIKGLTGGAVKG